MRLIKENENETVGRTFGALSWLFSAPWDSVHIVALSATGRNILCSIRQVQSCEQSWYLLLGVNAAIIAYMVYIHGSYRQACVYAHTSACTPRTLVLDCPSLFELYYCHARMLILTHTPKYYRLSVTVGNSCPPSPSPYQLQIPPSTPHNTPKAVVFDFFLVI